MHLVLRRQLLPLLLLFCFALSTTAFADNDRERTQVGNNISIGSGEEVSEATCFGCSIRVRGHVTGDVTSFGGNIVIEDQGQVDGDATAFAGGIRLDKEVKVGGDVNVFGGRIRRDAEARIGGEVTAMGGPGWIVPIVLAPLVFLGLLVALVVWIIRLVLRPSVPAAA